MPSCSCSNRSGYHYNTPPSCADCGWPVDEPWVCNDENFESFFERVAYTYPSMSAKFPVLPPTFQRFRNQSLEREAAGRAGFGLTYLSVLRNNPAEGQEECCDAALYAVLEVFREIHDGLDPQWDLAVRITRLAADMHELFEEWHQHQRGAP